MNNLSLRELATKLADGELSSSALTAQFLARIDAHNPQLNAFVTVLSEQATAQASQCDANASPHLLAGIPMAHKDIFCTQGVRTACGSKMLDNFVAPYDATVVSKLNACGAVMLGKTNMDEFAMGSSNENSFYGAVRNPWDQQRVPGGSSGGSAAAVAAGMVAYATGTDTGGSVRQPAAFCGITGLKPTYGRVSRFGMVAFASSLDQAGVLARSADDAALVLQAISGFDPADSTCADEPVGHYSPLDPANLASSAQKRPLRIGLPKQFFNEGLDSGVRERVEAALDVYRTAGAEIIDVELPHLPLSVPVYYVIAPAECSSNLSRFDGVRFGHRCEDPQDLTDLYNRSRTEGFGSEVIRRILTGTYVLSAGYYDAYYRKAQQVRRLIAQDFAKAFSQVDVLMGPTTPTTAFGLGDKKDDPVTMYLNDIFTLGVSLAGLPAMSIPCGLSEGLPVGLQIIAPHFAEAHMLHVAHQLQSTTDWHLAQPPVFDQNEASA